MSEITAFTAWLLADALPVFLNTEIIKVLIGVAILGVVVRLIISFLHY